MPKKPYILASLALLCALASAGSYIAYKSKAPNPTPVRGINRSMVIFSANNNTYLPNLNNASPPATQPATP